MFWFALLIWAVVTVAYEIIRPKPTFEDARPAGLGDFSFPTATEGRCVPIVWGQVQTKGPNLIWYGNFRKRAETEDVKTGMFSSETVTKFYRYYFGMQFAVCHGPVDELIGIKVNDKAAAGGVTGTGNTSINSPSMFGGDDHGSGGMVGSINWYAGDDTQIVNDYLNSKISGDVPAYRGIAHAVWRGGWIGNSTNVAPWAFEVKRIVDGLNLESYIGVGGSEPNDGDCNPMNVLYEILTDTDWGLSIDNGDIDTTNFQEVAETLHDEGNGFSMILDSATEVTKLIDEIQRQIDGSLFFNRATGQWQVSLARDDYTIGDLDIYDESNIVDVQEFTRQTWEETTNQMRVAFVSRDDDYKQTFAFAQDPANIDIQGQTVSADASYPGVKNEDLAKDIAARDLRAGSYPLAKVKFTVNRNAWALRPGDVFKFSWDRLGVTELVFRVGTINYGNLEDSKISIFAIQDIFAASSGFYSAPTGTGWETPTDDPAYASAGSTLIFEAPKQIVDQSKYPYQQPRVWMGCRFPGDGTTNMRAWSILDTTSPVSGTYVRDAEITGFILTATLDGALDEYGSTDARPDTSYTIDLDSVDTLDGLEVDGDSSLVAQLSTIIKVDDEYIGYEKAEDLGGGSWRLSRIHRGLFDTAPVAHDDAATVWFISQGGSLNGRLIYSTYDEILTQLRGVNGEGESTTEVETPEIEIHIDRSYLWPLPPRDPVLNSTYADKTVSADVQDISGTGRTGDDARAIKVEFTPRDWNVISPISDDVLSADWADDDPGFDIYLDLDPGGTPTVVGPIQIDDQDPTPVGYILRNDIIDALGDNAVIPTDANLRVESRHTLYSTEYTSRVPMRLDGITLSCSLIGNDDLTFGTVTNAASAAVVFGETGNYTFDIHYALPSSGYVEININAGGWTTLIAAAATSNTVAITASDSVQLRWVTSGPAAPQFFDITGPTAEMGYGVLE